jgi:muconolactone delta-isomerase
VVEVPNAGRTTQSGFNAGVTGCTGTVRPPPVRTFFRNPTIETSNGRFSPCRAARLFATLNTTRTAVSPISNAPVDADPQLARRILPREVRATVQLYLDGKIDQWYSLQGRAGVAFILNVTDPAAKHEMLEKLPLGQAHLMSFELMRLAPLSPRCQLLGTTEDSP